ncbi:MAG: hypothetical protein WC681_12700 [Sterolibacterium sp.]|jgi:hypothetical protein
MRYYRTLTQVNSIAAGGVIELSDADAEQLLKNGAVEEMNADHLIQRYGASGKLDSDLTKAVRQMREIAGRVNEQIAELDRKLEALTEDRSKLLSGSLHKEDALALIRADIQCKGEKFKDEMVNGILRNRHSTYAWNVSRKKEIDTYGHIGIPYLGREIHRGATSQGALYFYFPDQIEAGFRKVLDSLVWDENALRLDDIHGRVIAMEREMAELQAQRNTLAKQLAGMSAE